MLFHLATYHIFRFIGTHYSFTFFNTIVTDTSDLAFTCIWPHAIYRTCSIIGRPITGDADYGWRFSDPRTCQKALIQFQLLACPIIGRIFQTPEPRR